MIGKNSRGQIFSIVVNPWKREIFHIGPGVFKKNAVQINNLRNAAHIAFLLNLIKRNELQMWAYEMIENGKYDDYLLDLSNSKDDGDVLYALGEVSNDIDSTIFLIEYFFGFFKNNVNTELWPLLEEKIVSFFRILDLSHIVDKIKLFLITIRDDYELRQDGFGGSMDMPSDLINFLIEFNNFSKFQVEFDKINFPKLQLVR